MYEAGLSPNGSDPGADSEFAGGTFKVADPDGLDDLVSVTINGTVIALADLGNNNAIARSNGTLTVTAYNAATGEASYTYELTSPTADGAGTETDVFTLTTSDGTATSAPATITIEIVDDLPTAENDRQQHQRGYRHGNHRQRAEQRHERRGCRQGVRLLGKHHGQLRQLHRHRQRHLQLHAEQRVGRGSGAGYRREADRDLQLHP